MNPRHRRKGKTFLNVCTVQIKTKMACHIYIHMILAFHILRALTRINQNGQKFKSLFGPNIFHDYLKWQWKTWNGVFDITLHMHYLFPKYMHIHY